MSTAQLAEARKLLGVDELDDPRTVRQAWLRLVRAYHPDQAKTDPEEANRRLAEINAGFDLLCDAEAAEQEETPEATREQEDMRRAQAAERAARVRRSRESRQRAAHEGRDTINNALPANQEPRKPTAQWSAADAAYARSFRDARRILERPAPVPQHVAYA